MEYFRLRRVKAVSPLGRKTKWSRSAHSRHSGLSFSIFKKLPFHNSTPHSEHLESRRTENMTMSLPLLEVSTSLGFMFNWPVPFAILTREDVNGSRRERASSPALSQIVGIVPPSMTNSLPVIEEARSDAR